MGDVVPLQHPDPTIVARRKHNEDVASKAARLAEQDRHLARLLDKKPAHLQLVAEGGKETALHPAEIIKPAAKEHAIALAMEEYRRNIDPDKLSR